LCVEIDRAVTSTSRWWSRFMQAARKAVNQRRRFSKSRPSRELTTPTVRPAGKPAGHHANRDPSHWSNGLSPAFGMPKVNRAPRSCQARSRSAIRRQRRPAAPRSRCAASDQIRPRSSSRSSPQAGSDARSTPTGSNPACSSCSHSLGIKPPRPRRMQLGREKNVISPQK
jgi:hypothetical protein